MLLSCHSASIGMPLWTSQGEVSLEARLPSAPCPLHWSCGDMEIVFHCTLSIPNCWEFEVCSENGPRLHEECS